MPDEETPLVVSTDTGAQDVDVPVTEESTLVETPAVADETPLTPDADEQVGLMRQLIDNAEKPDEVVGDEDGPVVEPPPLPKSKDRKPGEGDKAPERVEVSWTHKGISHKEMMTPQAAESFYAKITTADQYAPLQKKYIEELERKANMLETGQQAPVVQESKPETIEDLMQLNPQQWVERWKPLVAECEKTGYFGDDGAFAEAFPQIAADLALIRAVGLPALYAVNQLSAGAKRDDERLYMQRFFTEMDTQLNELAKKGEAFAPLADNEMRAKFFGHLQKFNVDGDELFDPNFLAGQWRAFNQGMFEQVESDAAELAAKKRAEEIRRGTGARSGHTGSAPRKDAPNAQVGLMRRLVDRVE